MIVTAITTLAGAISIKVIGEWCGSGDYAFILLLLLAAFLLVVSPSSPC